MVPQGKRAQGRPKATWRRQVEKEIKAMGLTCWMIGQSLSDKVVRRNPRGFRPHCGPLRDLA